MLELPALEDGDDEAELVFPPAVLVGVAGADGVDALDDVDVDDDGKGTFNRYKKASFNWYKNVIKTNGKELE